MHYESILLALAGFGSLASAAPARNERHLGARAIDGLSAVHRSFSKRTTVVIQQTVVQPSVTIVQQNLDLVNQLALALEQEFAALVQSQLALVQQVETIKNNIRVNHFLARFAQVNTVIVCVTQVVDLRSRSSNNRYMVNQLLADNKAASSVVVMLTAASPMTIGVASTVPSLDLSGVLGSAAAASVVSSASAAAATGAPASNASAATDNSSSSLNIAAFDPSSPFGSIGQSIILPYGSKAPSLPNGAQIVPDPAAIILPGQVNLLVEDVNQFNQDCITVVQSGISSLFNLQAAAVQVASQIAAIQLSGLALGTAASLNAAVSALLSGGGSVTSLGSVSSSSKDPAEITTTSTSSASETATATSIWASTTAAANSEVSPTSSSVTADATANGAE